MKRLPIYSFVAVLCTVATAIYWRTFAHSALQSVVPPQHVQDGLAALIGMGAFLGVFVIQSRRR